MENLRELQKYSEKLQEKVQTWISGTTDELIRLRRTQPAWIQQMQSQGGPPPQMSIAAPSIQPQQTASSSAASTVPVKPAPVPRNPSMASAPRNAPFPGGMGADPWSEAWQKKQHQ